MKKSTRLYKRTMAIGMAVVLAMSIGITGCGSQKAETAMETESVTETESETLLESETETAIETELVTETDSESESETNTAEGQTEGTGNKSAAQTNASSSGKASTSTGSTSGSSGKSSAGKGSTSGSGSSKPSTSGSTSGSGSSKPSTSGSTSSSGGSKPSTGGNTSGSGSESSAGSTKPVHKHSYSASVTKQATCTSTGTKTYTCSCGDTYTESIAKVAHTWKECTSTVHHDATGHYETVVVKEGYDEQVKESRYVCNQCGYSTSSGTDIGDHLFSGDCQNYSTKVVVVDTIHHAAVTEERRVEDTAAYDETVVTGYKCSVCGTTK